MPMHLNLKEIIDYDPISFQVHEQSFLFFYINGFLQLIVWFPFVTRQIPYYNVNNH